MPTETKKPIEPEQVVGGAKEIVIQTIPDKFYGAALGAKIVDRKKETSASPAPASATPSAPGKTRSVLPVVLVVIVLLVGVAGGFLYFNRDLLFKPPTAPAITPEPPKPTPPPPVPAAPTDISATATSPTLVQLAWTDASNNEAGFRIERRVPTSGFMPVTSLPPNSTAYQDASVEPQASYVYRVIALNEGGESPASNEATVTIPALPPPPPESPKLPPAGLDSDSDGLTDLEEPLYGSLLRDPDTDKDSFLDGNEVFHLYNPASGKNAKLLESNLVKIFESPVGWKIYVPITWKADLNADGTKGTISTGHGETFSISFEANPAKQNIMDWYLERHPGTLSSQVVLITTKTGFSGLEGVDPLTTYFPWGDYVLVYKYDLDGQTFVNYRTTYEMMRNSIALSVISNFPASFLPTGPTDSVSVEPEPGALTTDTPQTGDAASPTTSSSTESEAMSSTP